MIVKGRRKNKGKRRHILQEEMNLEEERRKKRLDSIKRIGDTLKLKKKSKVIKVLLSLLFNVF